MPDCIYTPEAVVKATTKRNDRKLQLNQSQLLLNKLKRSTSLPLSTVDPESSMHIRIFKMWLCIVSGTLIDAIYVIVMVWTWRAWACSVFHYCTYVNRILASFVFLYCGIIMGIIIIVEPFEVAWHTAVLQNGYYRM